MTLKRRDPPSGGSRTQPPRRLGGYAHHVRQTSTVRTVFSCHAFLTVTTLSIMLWVSDPTDELRRLYPPLLTTAHVAEMMHCTIGDVRDKVHRKELPALRWGNQFRFFRDEVISVLTRVGDEDHQQAKDDQR